MSSAQQACPDENRLVGFSEGLGSEGERLSVEKHLAQCEPCVRLIAAIARPWSVREGPASQPAPSETGAPTLGRFQVLERLGAGGMGVVFAAYDPKLDRRVALKLVRGSIGPSARQGIEREAQAMARLAHPHVVPVFDVGSTEGQTWLVMELVDGGSLRRWLRASPAFEEIHDKLAQAGRGLKAAHAAGVLHRDFKPDNVLVGTDGRARVTDFGLSVFGAQPSRRSDGGTAGYLAPEVLRGEPAGPLSDQFSFAVTAFEALYGRRPFPDARSAYLAAIDRGELSVARPEKRVPDRTLAVLRRALSADPRERFASMSELLEQWALPAQRTRRWAAAGALLLLGSLALATERLHRQRVAACEEPARELASWVAPRVSQERRGGFTASGAPLAHDAWSRLEAGLSTLVEAWVEHRQTICRASFFPPAEPEPGNAACWRRRKANLESLARVYLAPEQRQVESVASALAGIPPMRACLEPLPKGRAATPEGRAEHARVDLGLSEARALLATGRFREAGVRAEALLTQARAFELRGFERDALQVLGEVAMKQGAFELAEKHVLESLWISEALEDHRAVAWAWIHLIWCLAPNPARRDEAYRAGAHAQAALQRVGGDDDLESTRLGHLGMVDLTAGFQAAALSNLKAAAELRERALGPFHPGTALALSNVAYVEADQGELSTALALQRRVVMLAEATLGAQHPNVSVARHNLGAILVERGEVAEGRRELERALDALREVLGPDDLQVGWARALLGHALLAEDRLTEAGAALEEARRVLEQTVPGEDPRKSFVAAGLGDLALAQGSFELAEQAYRRALTLLASIGPTGVEPARAQLRLAKLFLRSDRPALARQHLAAAEAALAPLSPPHRLLPAMIELARAELAAKEHRPAEADDRLTRALTELESTLEPGHPLVVGALLQRAAVSRALKDPVRTQATLEEALRRADANEATSSTRAEIRFQLAKVLWQRPRERARALRLAEEARDAWGLQQEHRESETQVAAWLSRRKRTRSST